MRDKWWVLPDATQRGCVLLGGVLIFLLLCAMTSLTAPWLPPNNFLIVLLLGGFIMSAAIIYTLDHYCLDPYTGVEVKFKVLLGNRLSDYNHYTYLRYINNQIRGLFNCYEKDYWVRLATEDFMDPTYLIDGDIDTVPKVPLTEWPLSDIVLAYDDYLISSENGTGLHTHCSDMDMRVREMFETCIIGFFRPLPVGLRKVYLNRLHEYNVSESLMCAIAEVHYWDVHD